MTSKNNWSFCLGANCSYINNKFDRQCLQDTSVKRAIKSGAGELDYYPQKVVIISSYECNNNCYFCFQPKLRKRNINYELNDNFVEQIKNDIIPNANIITFSGGEPLYSGKSLELIKWSLNNYPGKKYIIQTNGVLLHNFGLQKIMEKGIFLVISFYGMSKRIYNKVTGTRNYNSVYKNVKSLINAGYKHMFLNFIVSRYSVKDLEKFCSFVKDNKDIFGVVINNSYSGNKYHKIMRYYEKKFSFISARLKFSYRHETIFRRTIRRIYNPVNSLKYYSWSCKRV